MRRFKGFDHLRFSSARAALLIGLAMAGYSGVSHAQPMSLADTRQDPGVFDQVIRDEPDAQANSAAAIQMPAHLRRQVVDYFGREAPGTIIVDTAHTHLYLVQPGGKAIRYGIGVGRQGFTWAGTQTVARKAEWPDWYPPAEMIARQPYLPRFVAGGPTNPLGARAMYLGNTEYRIHGTNQPETIGHNVSSGCIRLANDDVIDLYSRVNVGAKVIVLPASASAQMPSQTRTASSLPAPAPAPSRGTISVRSTASAPQVYNAAPVARTAYSGSNSVSAHGLY